MYRVKVNGGRVRLERGREVWLLRKPDPHHLSGLLQAPARRCLLAAP